MLSGGMLIAGMLSGGMLILSRGGMITPVGARRIPAFDVESESVVGESDIVAWLAGVGSITVSGMPLLEGAGVESGSSTTTVLSIMTVVTESSLSWEDEASGNKPVKRSPSKESLFFDSDDDDLNGVGFGAG